jgi:chemotaxis protein CheD
VDTGVPLLFREVYSLRGKKKRMIVKAAGCATPLDNVEMFKIGERNFILLNRLLLKNNVSLNSKDVGGSISRTVYFDLATGQVVIGSRGKKRAI